MVHLSKFAGFDQEINGNVFIIAAPLQITKNFRIIVYKRPPTKGHLVSLIVRPCFSAPVAFVRLEPCLYILMKPILGPNIVIHNNMVPKS